ncbi:DUF2180 family protein [Streptomyces sp. DW26H14]|uniref:DUF2180 family protein n=1 Tax=Streptomyces sp. DW26H14 TaxID=3435395 RepID=UPI00403DA495
MNCFDCHATDHISSAAVATCRSCGSGVCGDHAYAFPQEIRALTGLGVSTKPLSARRILCGLCARAEHTR